MTTITTDILSHSGVSAWTAVKTLRLWIDAANTRRALKRLSDDHLTDLGLTRAEAEAEAARPFWDVAPR